ncbi:unnamed protein product [Dovyalis caffra]|uniref:Phytocyanin domain-containing protein n=1 Tax=Dovyalis caffra TaxID=77055 RepID=A0AAV1SBX1_9ROSI|nr:unnamed protein product [Dovyalis caffra]
MANIASALLILLLAAPAAFAATTYTVGDTSGWNTFGDYTTWASGKTFTVGDSLVAEVSKADYDSCSTSNLGKTYSDGSSTVPLSKVGAMYFICSTLGHCGSGMKLAVNVVAASGTPSTPTTPTSPSDGGSTTPSTPSDSPPTTPSTPVTPPPPKPSGATSIFYNMMLGVLLALGTTVALMG